MTCQKRKTRHKSCLSFLGFAACKAAPPFGIKMLGVGKAAPAQFSASLRIYAANAARPRRAVFRSVQSMQHPDLAHKTKSDLLLQVAFFIELQMKKDTTWVVSFFAFIDCALREFRYRPDSCCSPKELGSISEWGCGLRAAGPHRRTGAVHP